jgi:hypothetical protein
MQINDNERLAVEEAAIGMRGMLKWCKKKLKKGEDPDDVINGARNFKFQVSFFSFLNELFLWKENATDGEQQGRVYLISVDKIGVGMGEEFYFVSDTHLTKVQFLTIYRPPVTLCIVSSARMKKSSKPGSES